MSWYGCASEEVIPRIKEYLISFYDERTNECYDEAYYQPNKVECVMPYLLEPFCKVFAVFGKDEVYEIIAKKVE